VDFVLEGLADAMARISEFEYRSDEQFYAWVSRCIRNRIVDAAREEQAARRAGRPLPLEEGLNDPPARLQTPSTALFRDEMRAAIGDALVELQVKHPREMEAVVSKLFDDQTWPELRERFGLTSDKKARSLFARGIDLLRPLVKKSLGESAVREFLGQGGSS